MLQFSENESAEILRHKTAIKRYSLGPDLASLTLTSFHFPVNDKHRAFLEGLSGDALRFALNCFTVFAHERKHFHDVLATPYGSMLMRQSTRASLLTLASRDELLFRSDSIAVPLSQWIPNAKLFQLARGVPPPSDNLRELHNVLVSMQDKVAAFDRGTVEVPGAFKGLTATGILEGLAILAQEHEIERSFGSGSISPFRECFSNPTTELEYYGAIALCAAALGSDIPTECLSYCLLVSLCGDFQSADGHVPRCPVDVLMHLLVWLRQNSDRDSLYDPFRFFEKVDEFFEETFSDDVEGLTMKASQTNAKITPAFAEMVKRSEDLFGDDGAARTVFDAFENFREVQAGFAANVFIEPLWYVGAGYRENIDALPKPVVFLECNTGLPIDPSLEDIYYIQTESRLNLAEFPPDIARTFRHLADHQGIVRGAHVLSPRSARFSPPTGKYPVQFGFKVSEIDVDLWQRAFDRAGGSLRFLLNGPDGLVEPLLKTIVLGFALVGARVYSTSGELKPPPVPEDPNNPSIDPEFRKLLTDPHFAEALKLLRARRDSATSK